MKNQTTIIFDLDGTLADTGPDLMASLNHALAEKDFPMMERPQIGHLVGHGSIAMIRKAYEMHQRDLNDEQLGILHRRFLDHYQENLAIHSNLFPGVLPLLDQLLSDGYKLAVCTNKYEKMARKFLSEFKIDRKFLAVTGGDTFEFRKPDGRHLLETVKQAEGNPTQTIMVGDTITDANAAKSAQMPLILVDFGYSDTPVHDFDPDFVISHFDEAVPAIKKIGERF